MLFHVTATHTPEDCPGYNIDKMPAVVEAFEKSGDLAKELNLKVHFLVSGAPEHVSYALVEADSVGAVARFANSFPYRQDFKITAVTPEQEFMDLARAMMAQHS